MQLGELIAALEAADPRLVVPNGFTDPHSYRDYYDELAFAPARNVTVAAMLAAARSALGTTYTGYKGGDYTMGEHTDCWIAEWGGLGETLGPTLLRLLLEAGAVPGEAAEPDAWPGLVAVYASIGNSDDRLTQARWSGLARRFENEINQYATRVHGVWYSAPDAPFQNACVCFEIEADDAAFVRGQLGRVAAAFEQDSIAWAVVQGTEFITPADVPVKPRVFDPDSLGEVARRG